MNSPVHLVKLGLTAPLYREKIFANLDWQYASERKTLAGLSARDFGTANLTLFSRGLIKGVEISASVYNLSTRTTASRAGPSHLQDLIPQDGRTWRIKATWRF